jgi:hypothetical protein
MDEAGYMTLPDVIPDWVLEDAPLPDGPYCDCGRPCIEPVDEPEPAWATPGVTGLEPVEKLDVLPPVSAPVAQLQQLVAALQAQQPAALPGAQALADGAALLEVEQQLRVLNLGRVGDVDARGLFELVGSRSAKSWLREHRPDGDASDARLSRQLRAHPALQAAVADGRVSLAAQGRARADVGLLVPGPDRRPHRRPARRRGAARRGAPRPAAGLPQPARPG